MLFHEYAMTPHLFSKKYCGDNIAVQKDLIYFLKGLRENGMIANINKEQWQKEVKEYLSTLPLGVRDKLSQLLQELKKHNRLVTHESVYRGNLSDDEVEWVDLMMEEDMIEPYDAMLFTGRTEKLKPNHYTIEQLLDDPTWDNRANSFVIKQTKSTLKSYLSAFLMYARKLTIIDPYFTYNRTDEEALIVYAELFAKRRGSRLKNRKIIIHTSYNTRDKFVDINSEEYKIKWVRILRKIYEKYEHKVILNIWEDNNRIKVLHDRHMITDQGGIHAGRGFNIVDSESTWNLTSYETQRINLNYFEANYNSDLRLVFTLDKEYDIPEHNANYGVIKKLIQDDDRGKAGFVALPEGKELYFRMPATFYLCSEIEVGTKVEFEIGENYRGEIAKVIKILDN